ncbi:hypothetical protein SAMN05421774_105126 [Gemmobacter megaterium]|uniref:Uncharacterized protein n=1 Tax=Gemmobacter megaterium TaxID=1086013 RepID=A0A1N7PBU9_9RHOB|nr:hypothetical protein [Gemmobacter megaterium]GGE19215.1 hypothetical protein GCM10011345_26370 [Gemmobacter megaterium]SIT08061.1 hypothetical protein SAMN05421774_105126 [Gemmobacter megaterium]
MPKLVRLYIVNVAIGFGLSAVFLGVLLGLDVAGLRHLILGSQMGWLAGVMIFMFSGTIFAGVQFGIAVMAMAERDDPPQGGLRQHDALIPVRAEAAVRKRR